MIENKFIFLKDAFSEFEIQFADDFSNAVIVNPHYNENITIYDEEYEFIVCFSFQHRHLEDEEEIIEWIRKIISGDIFALEFFHNEKRCFGGEIEAEQLKNLSYEKLEQFTGYFGLTKLLDVADSCKIRGWDRKNNGDFTFFREADGHIAIHKTNFT